MSHRYLINGRANLCGSCESNYNCCDIASSSTTYPEAWGGVINVLSRTGPSIITYCQHLGDPQVPAFISVHGKEDSLIEPESSFCYGYKHKYLEAF